MSPFSVEKFSDSEQMKAAVEKLGFTLTAEEHRRWSEWGRFRRGEIDSLDF